MTAACRSTSIRVEACSDIFQAIEKGKSRAFSCVIADWADQPEAGFLLKRARESALNRETVAIAIVDHEPTSAEMHDNHLDFLIYRPISDEEAHAVLAKACEQMKPLGAADAAESGDDGSTGASQVAAGGNATEHSEQGQSAGFQEGDTSDGNGDSETASDEGEFREHHRAIGLREVSTAELVLVATFLR